MFNQQADDINKTKISKKIKSKKKKLNSKKPKDSEVSFISGTFISRNKDLLKRVGFTLLVLLLIRVLSFVTIPGVSLTDKFKNSNVSNSEFFQLLSTLGGGTIGNFSIVALGVSPYITASIIVQLLSTDVIPVLTNWAKSGERGKRKLDKLTKVLSIPFALMQAIATIFTLTSQNFITVKWSGNESGTAPAWFYYMLVPLVMLAGSFFVLWLSDQITLRGIGNGVSIIIFAGIMSKMPGNITTTFSFWINKNEDAPILLDGILKFIIYLAAFLFVIYLIVVMNEAERKIPIQQTGAGLVDATEHTPYLPLKLNNAGVIPVIFSSAIISTPVTVSQIMSSSGQASGFVSFCQNYLSFNTWNGIAIYAILTILFTFLYSQVQLNPEKIAENFKKSGTFIPGVTPGKDTEKFISATINRLSWMGSFFLAFIAILPYVISKITNLPSNLAIGGTGLIIVISVSIQTIQQVKSRLIEQEFVNRKNNKLGADNMRKTHIW